MASTVILNPQNLPMKNLESVNRFVQRRRYGGIWWEISVKCQDGLIFAISGIIGGNEKCLKNMP